MTEAQAFRYRLTEAGDIYISGQMPDFLMPEEAPYYSERERIVRVVAEQGATIGTNAFCECPNLRVASLVGARRVGANAFFGCRRLAALSFSPLTLSVANNAIGECPGLVFVDFAGDEQALEASYPIALLLSEGRLVRTVPSGEGETVAAGELGNGGYWCLTSDGTLTVDGDDIPDCRYPQDAPWYIHRDAIVRVIVGGAVGRIGVRAFYMLPHLTYAAVVGNTEVGALAFSSCARLSEIVLFPGVHTLGDYAFAGTAAVAFFAGASVRKLQTGLLSSCHSLRTVLLPLLPLQEAKDAFTDCRALREIKCFGSAEDIDAMMAVRAVSLPRRPVSVLATLTPEAAERALGKAEARRAKVARAALRVEKGHAEAESLCLSVYEQVGAADTAFVKYEKRRSGFAEPEEEKECKDKKCSSRPKKPIIGGKKEIEPENSGKPTDGGKASRLLKKDAAALRREHRALVRVSDKLIRRLSRLSKDAKRLERACARAERSVSVARGRIAALYPFGGTMSLRADGIASYMGTAGVCTPLAYATGAERARNFAELFPYHRYQEVHYRYADLAALMEGLTPDAPPKGRVQPRILIAGRMQGEDLNAEACAHAIRRAGGIPVMASGSPTDRGFDALVLCDGAPVDPILYDERRHGMRADEGQDRRDGALFDAFFLYGKPILGIGRGCELLNVRLGGTLYRQLSEKHMAAHRGGKIHPLEVDPQSYLYKLYKPAVRPIHVISCHDSGLCDLGRGLAAVARTEDGVIESVAHTGQPVYGVMFSPERMPARTVSPFSIKADCPENGDILFAWFCDLAREKREAPLTKKIGKRFSEEE